MTDPDTAADRLRSTLDDDGSDDGPPPLARAWNLVANAGAFAAMGYCLWCGLDMVVGWPVPPARAFVGLWIVLAVLGLAAVLAAMVVRAASALHEFVGSAYHGASEDARRGDGA